jgi:hypothetical protein
MSEPPRRSLLFSTPHGGGETRSLGSEQSGRRPPLHMMRGPSSPLEQPPACCDGPFRPYLVRVGDRHRQLVSGVAGAEGAKLASAHFRSGPGHGKDAVLSAASAVATKRLGIGLFGPLGSGTGCTSAVTPTRSEVVGPARGGAGGGGEGGWGGGGRGGGVGGEGIQARSERVRDALRARYSNAPRRGSDVSYFPRSGLVVAVLHLIAAQSRGDREGSLQS